MARKLQEGDKVLCRYFNTPDKHFYGVFFMATIVTTDPRHRDYMVKRHDDGRCVNLWRKEILRRIN